MRTTLVHPHAGRDAQPLLSAQPGFDAGACQATNAKPLQPSSPLQSSQATTQPTLLTPPPPQPSHGVGKSTGMACQQHDLDAAAQASLPAPITRSIAHAASQTDGEAASGTLEPPPPPCEAMQPEGKGAAGEVDPSPPAHAAAQPESNGAADALDSPLSSHTFMQLADGPGAPDEDAHIAARAVDVGAPVAIPRAGERDSDEVVPKVSRLPAAYACILGTPPPPEPSGRTRHMSPSAAAPPR